MVEETSNPEKPSTETGGGEAAVKEKAKAIEETGK